MALASLNDTDPQEGTETLASSRSWQCTRRLNDTDPQEGTETSPAAAPGSGNLSVLTTPTRKRVLKHGSTRVRFSILIGLNDTDPQEGTETDLLESLAAAYRAS